MQVYLIRHGIAASRGTYTDDDKRPLISKGIKKTTQVARKLQGLDIQFDQILTSPLVRAYQTAEILLQENLSSNMEISTFLQPGSEMEDWLAWLQTWQSDRPEGNLALVGHEPDLSNWAEMLVWGAIQRRIILKKAGVVGLQLPRIGSPIARSTLFLLASPKWLTP